MDAARIPDPIALLAVAPSRRTAVRGVIASALAASGMVFRHESGDAGKAANRRRRRRRRCLRACAGPCDFCFFDVAGKIHCADGSGATCDESVFCTSNDECLGTCLKAVQIKGSAKIRPLADASCNFPNGICSQLLVCSP